MRKVFTTAAVALAAISLIAACGGDDDDDVSADAESLPSEEFVERADGLCEENQTAIDAEVTAVIEANPELAEAAGPEDVPQEVIDEIIDVGVRSYGDLLPKLRAIAPEGDEEAWGQVLDDLETAIGEVQENPEDFFAQDAEDPFDAAREGAQELGLEVCGAN